MPKIRVGETDVLILCGGLGTRFREVRNDIPKSLAPIQGTPFIDLLLNDLIVQGFRRIILATGYLSDQLEDYVNRRKDAEYIISNEPKPLGTGGAIKFAQSKLVSNPVLVLNGDSRIKFDSLDLFKIYNEQQCDVVMLLSKSTMGSDYGNVTMEASGQISQFTEKPTKTSDSTYVNAGVYLISSKIIQNIPQITKIYD